MKIYFGAMSGTSCDGFDLVACTFDDNTGKAEVTASDFTPYPDSISGRLHAITIATQIKKSAINDINRALAHFWSGCINRFIDENGFDRSQIEAIGIHGHTIDHQVDGEHPGSWQLCEPNTISAETGLVVVSDFRNMDIALGGQGAPLLPPAHEVLFRAEKPRVVCNIGGIANITILTQDEPLVGFDTGPGNTLMDAWARHAFEKEYDPDGEIAKSGEVNQPLLESLLGEPYFSAPVPKSTGREKFNMAWLEPAIEALPYPVSGEDMMATLTELTAITIANEIKPFMSEGDVVVCGGGSMNPFLMSRLQANLGGTFKVDTSEAFGIHPSFVEAFGFAWLAYRRLNMMPGNSPHTGAKSLGLLGGVFSPYKNG